VLRRGGPSLDGPRPARAEELPEIVDLVNLVFRSGGGCGPTMQQEFPLLLSAENADHLYIIRKAGQLVAHVGVLRQEMVIEEVRLPVACVGSVATHPQHRRRGYASSLMDFAIQQARRDGCVLMAISGDLPLYSRRGAAAIRPIRHAELPAEWVTAGPVAPQIRPVEPGDVDALAGLLASEPVRYEVSPGKLPLLLDAHLRFGCAGWVWQAGSGSLEAFLLVRHRGPRYHGGPNRGQVVVFAGDRGRLPAMAAAAIRTLGIRALCIDLMPTDDVTAGRLASAGVALQDRQSHWTVVVLDVAGLLERLAPRWADLPQIILRADRDGLVVGAVDDFVRLGTAQEVAAVLFSEPQYWPAAIRRLNEDRRAMLQAVLPVPLADYGLSFV